MCNNYVFRPPDDRLFSHLKLGGNLTYPHGVPNIGESDIRIGDRAPIITRLDDALAMTMTPWSWKGPGGRPVFNFRSEGRLFSDSQRCLIPADGFYEFTDAQPGEKRKTKWLFSMVEHPSFWIAGLIRDGAFAMLTTEPGPDVQPYHDRQIVLLEPAQGLAWLDLTRPETQLLLPARPGALAVRRVYPPAA